MTVHVLLFLFSDTIDYSPAKTSSLSGYPARPHSYYANGNNDWNKDGIHPKSPGVLLQLARVQYKKTKTGVLKPKFPQSL